MTFFKPSWCHALHNLIQHTFPTFGNIKHFILSMLTIFSIIECTIRNIGHGGNNFFPTNMFSRKVKLGSKKLFLTHNLYANLAPNLCDKFVFIQHTFCPWQFCCLGFLIFFIQLKISKLEIARGFKRSHVQ
jgi:hypothetical protein